MKLTIALLLIVGCGRAPLQTEDSATLPGDAATVTAPADMAEPPPTADMALPCAQVSATDCAYAFGTEGCAPGYCRAEHVPDMWSAGCASGGDLCP